MCALIAAAYPFLYPVTVVDAQFHLHENLAVSLVQTVSPTSPTTPCNPVVEPFLPVLSFGVILIDHHLRRAGVGAAG